MREIKHQFVKTNDIKIHFAEQGKGPLVVLCHGFPESWYSWRYQLPALAKAGYRVVAPDQRGYGQTDRPELIEDYNILQLTGDIVGLVHSLGQERAVIVGHDWGAVVACHCALLRPDIFNAIALLSVPYLAGSWKHIRPTDAMKRMSGDFQFYQLYFQEPGKAEAEMEADIRRTVRMFLYSASGDPPPDRRWRFLFNKSERFIDSGSVPESLPAWLSEEDLNFFSKEIERTGFRGGLNWYRNIDRNWELTRFLSGAKINQPALFVAGENDACMTMYQKAFEVLETNVPNLTKKIVLPGAGHWIQQERANEVNELLVSFLDNL
jgi:pimeloyl-ACP methyl ester carboxylesterase